MIVKDVEKKENNEVSFQVEIDSTEFEAALQKAYLKNRNLVTVPGFRKGKAPRAVIEGMYGRSAFYEEAINELSTPAFDFAVESEGLKTVGKPACTDMDVSDDKVLLLTFESALYPEVTLGQYIGLEAPKGTPEVDPGFVDSELKRLQLRNSRLSTVERAAETGDTAVIDYAGKIDGVLFEGGSADGYSLELGSGQFVPGFEEQVVGMKAGDECDIDIVFPEEYHEDIAGKAAVFHVKVNEVKERELPEIDDEFAKDISESDTLEDYKKVLVEAELARLVGVAQQAFHDELLVQAISNMAAVIPDAMIDERQEAIVQDYANGITMQGMQFEQYLAMMGMDYDAFYESARPAALRHVQTELLLTKIADVENIEVSDEEIEEEFRTLAEMYNVDLETVKAAAYNETGIRNDHRVKAAAELIYSSGIAVEPAAKEEGKEEAVEAVEEAEEKSE